MALQVSHPVEVGIYGRFKYGGKWLVQTWIALEEICLEYCGGLFIGIYSARDVINWGKRIGLLTPEEYEKIAQAL